MRKSLVLGLALCFVAVAAEAWAAPKKKKPGKYNATEFIKTKESKTPIVTTGAKGAAKSVPGYKDGDCSPVESSPTAPKAMTDKPADEVRTGEAAPANSTQQALEMAKTVVKTVKENCRSEKPASIEPAVGVSVVQPGDLGAKESKGERPELSGTVGVNATF